MLDFPDRGCISRTDLFSTPRGFMLAKDRNDLGEGILRAHVLVGRIAIVVTALAIVGYAWEVSIWRGTWSNPSRLGGGTPVGLASGTVAGLIVLFEMLLWPRKALRRFRLVRTKYWMVAHVWFGLAVVPICFVHCGFVSGGVVTTVFLVGIFVTATNSKSDTHLKGNAQKSATTPVATGWARPSHLNFWLLSFVISSIAFISFSSMFLDSVFGGLFTTLFLFLTVLTVASGVYGWSMQKSLPRDMMHQVPSETIYSQIDQTLETYLSDTETYLSLACGNRPGTKETEVTRFESDDLRMVAAPTLASHERIQGKSLQTEMVRGSHEDRERLWGCLRENLPVYQTRESG